MAATFLAIGSYMIYSDVRKNHKPNRNPGGLTKTKIVFLILLVLLGTAFVSLSRIGVASDRQLTQIGYENNAAGLNSYTIFLQQGTVCQIDLTVNVTEIGQWYNVSVRLVEENHTFTGAAGPIEGQIVRTSFIAFRTGHYEVDWKDLQVTQLTAYSVDTVTPLISKSVLSGAGVFTFVMGALSILGFERRVFYNRKTGIFWWGLMLFGAAISWLFALLWWTLVSSLQYNPFSLGSLDDVAEILASLLFMFIGFQLMKIGTTKENHLLESATESRMIRLQFYLSQRNYRASVYLLTSIVINALALAQPNLMHIDFFYIDWVGFILLFFIYGRPSMYGGWIDPRTILPYAILVFGLFVEIFVVCEFLIYVERRLPRMRKPESLNSSA